jgi:putative transposase
MKGVSTRHYEGVLPEMAESCSVSKSSVSREFIEASTQTLQELCARRFDDVELLGVYID